MIDADSRSLAGELGTRLEASGLVCVTAESCTGGLLAAALTACAGASHWFERGYVTYSNAAKMELLQVLPQTLERHGAVSEATAMEMAAGALVSVPSAGLALSTTGIAGPGGATPGKPVGMVCFGLAQRTAGGIASRADVRVFEGDRDAVRLASVHHVLRMALEALGSSPAGLAARSGL